MSYTRPTGDNVVGTFGPAYTRPAGGSTDAVFTGPPLPYPQLASSVELRFGTPADTSSTGIELVFSVKQAVIGPQTLAPSGRNQGEFGTASFVWNRNLSPTGISAIVFGTAKVLGPQYLTFAGVNTATFGVASAVLATPSVSPEGLHSLAFGTAYIAPKPLPTTVTFNGVPSTGPYTFVSGTAWTSHLLRIIDVETGPGTLWGTAFIGDRYRYLTVSGVQASGFGIPEVTFPKQLHVPGTDQSLFGTPQVGFSNVAFPAGLATGSVGQPWVSSRTRHVLPFAQQYIEWGGHKIDLWQRYLLVSQPPESDADGEIFGQYTEVRNRNKTIRPVGLLAQRISTSPAYVELTGRALQPPSIDDGAYGGGTFISYRIRFLRVPGYELDRYPNNKYVYNTAATVRPDSFGTLGFGAHLIDRRLKYLTPSGHRADAYGHAWVSASPRNVRPVGTDQGGRTNTHYVSHSPYLVQFSGFDNLRLGPPFLFIRPPITVYATWGQLWVQDQKQMGIPRLRRYPPLIEVPGRPYTEFAVPAAFASFRVRTLQPPSVAGQERWGTHVVRDRKFTVRVDGTRTDRYGLNLRVEKLTPDPIYPSLQYITCGPGTTTFYGSTEFDLRWLVVPSVGPTAQFGEPECQSNTVLFKNRHHPSSSQGFLQFGMTVIPGRHTVTLQGLVAPPTGHPIISPHHVYCTLDIPQTYKENFHYATDQMQWDDSGADQNRFLNGRIGSPRVTSVRPQTIRSFYTSGGYPSIAPTFGSHTLFKRLQEVFPPSFTPFRSGTPKLRPYTQYLGPRGRSMLTLGVPRIPPVERAPLIDVLGLNAFQSGYSEITLSNRSIFVQGSMLTNPLPAHGYNGLTYPIVGDWIKAYPSYDAALFGTADVTNYVRYVSPESVEGVWGDTRVIRETQTLYLRGNEYSGFGVFDNTREMTVRPYSVTFFCPTSPFTQVLHA